MCCHSFAYVMVYLPCVHKICHAMPPLNFYLGTYTKYGKSHTSHMSQSCGWCIHLTPTLKVHHKVDMSNLGFHLKRNLYFSCVWLGVNLKIDTKKTCVEQRLDYVLISLLTTFQICQSTLFFPFFGGGRTHMIIYQVRESSLQP